MNYAISITRKLGKIVSIIVVNTENDNVSHISSFRLYKKLESGYKIENICIGDNGDIREAKIDNERKNMYYAVVVQGLEVSYRYALALRSKDYMVDCIACKKSGEITHLYGTVDDIEHNLDIKSGKLKFMNAVMRNMYGRVAVDIFDKYSNCYIEQKNSKEIEEEEEIYRKWDDCKIGTVLKREDGTFEVNDIDCNSANVKVTKGVAKISNVFGATTFESGETLVEVAPYSFYEDGTIQKFIGGKSLRVIGKCAFEGSTVVRINKIIGLDEISDKAFSDSMVTGNIVVGANRIGIRAFYNNNISKVKIIDTEVIDIEAFGYNTSLKEVDIVGKLEIICEGAFRNTALSEISIPKSCESILNGAFRGCSKLKKALVPMNTYIDSGAFDKGVRIVRY